MNSRIFYALILLALYAYTSNSSAQEARTLEITVASKKFTESVILGEILSQLIRTKGHHVIHKKELGGTRVLWAALIAGEIDAYVEYTGTLEQELFAGQDVHTDKLLDQALVKLG